MAQTPGGVYYQAPETATLTVDLADCTKTGDLLQALGRALAFPDWYGGNFDALFDCLCDSPLPPILRLTGLASFARAQPDDFTTLTNVLRAACDTRADAGQPLTVLIDTPASGIADWPGT
jgi:RNAse (barnase) inhibitor barstar